MCAHNTFAGCRHGGGGTRGQGEVDGVDSGGSEASETRPECWGVVVRWLRVGRSVGRSVVMQLLYVGIRVYIIYICFMRARLHLRNVNECGECVCCEHRKRRNARLCVLFKMCFASKCTHTQTHTAICGSVSARNTNGNIDFTYLYCAKYPHTRTCEKNVTNGALAECRARVYYDFRRVQFHTILPGNRGRGLG